MFKTKQFKFKNLADGKKYSIPDENLIKQFIDKYERAVSNYIMNHGPCENSIVSYISWLDVMDGWKTKKEEWRNKQEAIEMTLESRNLFAEQSNVTYEELLLFENELGIHIWKLQKEGYDGAFKNKNKKKVALAKAYLEYLTYAPPTFPTF